VQEASKEKQRKTYTAKVIKDRMDKTVVVAVTKSFIHPIYKKVMRKTTRLKAHDVQNQCQVGDRVRIQETRPISKDKHWRVVEIMERTAQHKQATEELPVISSQ
jgi:small subunit ribosomal protein S17